MGTQVSDYQRDALYAAEEHAEGELWFDNDPMTPEAVAEFVANALVRAGWEVDRQPKVVFDVADDDERSGFYSAADEALHLHPKLLRPPVVLHELAHWCRPNDLHGPQFCGAYLTFLEAVLGREVAEQFATSFDSHGVVVDAAWWHRPDLATGDQGEPARSE